MEEAKVKDYKNVKRESELESEKKVKPKKWQKPTLEDVSEKIMAQPYIRFT